MRAQAQLAATLDKRYEQAFEAGVTAGNAGTKAVEALHDPLVAKISAAANAADHQHDKIVTTQLFPAAERGDRAGAVPAEQSSASTEQVSATKQHSSAASQQIAASAHELARTAESLQRVAVQLTR